MKATAHALALAVAVAAPVLSVAQEAEGADSAYAVFRAGGTFPQHKDLDGYDNGFALEGGLGFQLGSGLAVEATVGRFAIEASEQFFDASIGEVVTVTGTATAISLAASIKLGIPVQSVEFYGLAGAGLYFVNLDLRATAPGYYPLEESDRDTAFGFHLGAGLSVRVSPKASLGLEAKYIIASATLFDEKGGIDSMLVTGGLGYRF